MSASDGVPTNMGQLNVPVFGCQHCPAEYTTAVNLRAHTLGKHGVTVGVTDLTKVTTRELAAEMGARMDEWPTTMEGARAFLRGAWLAIEEAARQNPDGVVEQALRARRS